MAVTKGFSAELKGLQALKDRLAIMPARVRDNVLKPALTEAAAPILAAAKELCPVNHDELAALGLAGVVRDSLGLTVRVNSLKGTVTVAIGPRAGFDKTAVTPSGEPVTVEPVIVAGWLENGHGGPHPAPAYPFMRPAFDQHQEQATEIALQKIFEGIQADWRAQGVANPKIHWTAGGDRLRKPVPVDNTPALLPPKVHWSAVSGPHVEER